MAMEASMDGSTMEVEKCEEEDGGGVSPAIDSRGGVGDGSQPQLLKKKKFFNRTNREPGAKPPGASQSGADQYLTRNHDQETSLPKSKSKQINKNQDSYATTTLNLQKNALYKKRSKRGAAFNIAEAVE
ncbi:hypothetical protein Scep_001334 [Stephania cephalantha]|uniref:Uncharacterized protein n=1 Tax=Stephania cephalantha TaxID=152367 RepID=A0AAP0L953_9MAGN